MSDLFKQIEEEMRRLKTVDSTIALMQSSAKKKLDLHLSTSQKDESSS